MSTAKRPDSLRAQIGPFAMVPVWLLDRCTDSRAIHLYALIGKYANRQRRAWPKSEQLAAAMGTSVRSIERGIAVLRIAGALKTERKRRADGAVIGLDFILIQIDPVSEQQPATSGGKSNAPVPNKQHVTRVGLSRLSQSAAGGANDTPAQPATGGGQSSVHPATGVGAIPTPVAGSTKEEPDPFNQIQEQEKREAAAQPPLLSIQVETPTPEDLAAFWNSRTTLPIRRCERLTDGRRKHARARLAERSWEDWRAIVARIEQSAFCRGQNDRGWVASFTWLIESPDVAVKVIEGVYDDRPKPEKPFTAEELTSARRVRDANGRCKHAERCPDYQACVARIIRGWRLKRQAPAA